MSDPDLVKTQVAGGAHAEAPETTLFGGLWRFLAGHRLWWVVSTVVVVAWVLVLLRMQRTPEVGTFAYRMF